MIEALTAGVYWSTPSRRGLYVIVRAGSYKEITSAETEAEAMRQATRRGWKPEDPEPSDPSGPIVGRWYRVFWFYVLMGGPEMAPQTPQRSERPGEAVALLDTPQRSERPGEAVALLDTPQRSERPGEAVALLDTPLA